jgi:glycosyltransferase involved in cell wall biosynthesis
MDISIIIPTYNRLWCLPAAIESCKNTTCKTEIIVIDDGSADGTWEWLSQQKNIISIRQLNSGKCWAVNKGFEIARGKYIRFLDSDDMVDKFANDEQFDLAEQGDADIAVSGYSNFNSENKVLRIQPWVNTNDFIAQQLGEDDGSHYSAFLFKRNFIADIPHRPDFAFRDDRLFILEAALKNPVIAVHNGTALLHRVDHNDRLQITGGLQQQVQNYQHLNIYKRILNQLLVQNRLTSRRIDAAVSVLWPLAHWIAIYDLAEANNLVSWIYQLNPKFNAPESGALGFLYNNAGFTLTEKLLRIRRVLKRTKSVF